MPFFSNNLPRTNINNTWTGLQTFGDDITLADTVNVIINTSTGSKIGTNANQKLSFWNATPVVQPGHITDPAANSAALKVAVDLILADLAEIGLQATS